MATRRAHPINVLVASLLALALLATIVGPITPRLAGASAPSSLAAASGPWALERLSVAADGAEADGDSYAPAISADGGSVAFETWATNLVSPTTSGGSVVLRSLATGATERVSVDTAGTPYTGPREAALSTDAQKVAMSVTSSGERALAVRDRAAGTAGFVGPGIGLASPELSDAGDRVVYVQQDTNPFDDDQRDQLWLYDNRPLGPSDPRDVNISNLTGLTDEASRPALSGDGNTIAYAVRVSGTAGTRVHDASVRPIGAPEWYPGAHDPALSADGRFLVTFRTDPQSGAPIVHRLDRVSGEETTVATLPANGDQLDVSADGSIVAYLVTYRDDADENRTEIRVTTVGTGITQAVATVDPGTVLDLSADGQSVVFSTAAAGVVPDDTNRTSDVFIARRTDSTAPVWPLGAALVADTVTSNLVGLHWAAAQDDTGIAGYVLRQGGQTVADLPAATTSHQVSGLDPETPYTFDLVAVDLDGNASSTLVREVFTAPAPTDPGTAALSAKVTGGSVLLQWDPAVEPVDGYRVLRAEGAGELVAVTDLLPPESIDHLDGDLPAETTFRYAVDVVRGGEEIRHTVEVSATTPAVTLDWVTWTGEGRLGTDVAISSSSPEGWATTAEVEYRTWLAEDGSVLPEPRAATAVVPMAPDWSTAGLHKATFPLADGTTEVTRVTGVVADGHGREQRLVAERAALPVAAALAITLEAPAGSLAGSRIVVTNVGQALVTGGGVTEFPVVPAGTRIVQVLSSKNQLLASGTVEAVAGRRASLTLTPALPATVSVNVTDAGGAPVSGASVRVETESGAYLGGATTDQLGRAIPPAEATLGSTVVVKVKPPTALPADTSAAPVVLDAGRNELEVALPALPTGSVGGTVTLEDGTPAAGARIVMSQRVDGRSWSYTTEVDEAGRYDLSGLAGTATLSVSLLSEAPFKVGPVELGGTPEVLDIVLPIPSLYTIDLSVFTKTVDDAGWRGPVDVDWATAIHLGLKATTPRTGFPLTSDRFTIVGEPGDVVKVCSNGREAGLTSPCQTITLGEARLVPVELRMQAVARVSARIVPPAATPPLHVYSELSKIRPDGQAERIFGYPVLDNALTVDLATAGRYRLWLSTDLGSRWVDFEVAEGEHVDLGDIVLSNTPWATLSGMTASRRIVLPGGRTDVRAQLHPGKVGPVTGATAAFTVPAGTQVVDGSVLVDGQPAVGTVQDGTLRVPLPDRTFTQQYDVRQAFIVRFQLQLTDAQPGAELLSTASVAYAGDNVGTPVAALNLRVATVTVEGAARTARRLVTLSGLAPPGATVSLADGRISIGEAVAGPGGLWSLTTELPDLGNGADHGIVGTVQADGQLLVSDPLGIVVDERMPELQRVTLARDGASASFDPREGVARFPMVYRGSSFSVTAEFGGRGTVEGVNASIGGYSGPATQTGDRTWSVNLGTTMSGIGGVGVRYDGVPEVSTLTSEQRPTLDEARLRLPLGLADVGEPVIDTPPPSGDTTESTFTVPTPNLGSGTTLAGTLTLTRGLTYTPTAADLLAAKTTGTQMWGATFDWARQGEQLVVTVSGYVPESLLNDPAAGLSASSATLNATVARWGFQAAFSSAQAIDSGSTAASTSDKYDRLNNLLDAVNAGCDSLNGSIYREALQGLNERALATDATHAALMLAGVVLAPGTFGVGTLVVWGATFFLDKQADYLMDGAISDLAAQIATDCPRPDNRPPDLPDPRDDDPLADPAWIYDPSGFVFEAVPSNRLPGATATLLYSEAPGGPFTPWNADWYGQANPLVTDEQGTYGWDVPEGFWQVVYTKDGYETGRSEVLEVLPPHFDVNVGLVSKAVPEVTKLAATAGAASSVDVTFSRYMQLSVGTDSLVTLTDPQGAPVAGTIAPVDAEDGPAGRFARTFRFTPAAPLTGDAVYGVQVAETAASYAGVLLVGGYSGTVTAVAPPPPPGPTCTITGTEGPDLLVGTRGDDVICGLGGNDIVVAGQGNDLVLGGAGNDLVVGSGGGDELDGGAGQDVLLAGDGADLLQGGDGVDALDGGSGDDRLDGGAARDLVDGGRGRDGWRRGDDARALRVEYRY